jgi:hypothetical protein
MKGNYMGINQVLTVEIPEIEKSSHPFRREMLTAINQTVATLKMHLAEIGDAR